MPSGSITFAKPVYIRGRPGGNPIYFPGPSVIPSYGPHSDQTDPNYIYLQNNLALILGPYAGAPYKILSVPQDVQTLKKGSVTDAEGPRISDINVNGSAYGVPIPIVYGTMRVGGNNIWAGGIYERSTLTSSEPTSNGDYTNTTDYSYFGTFAIGIAEGIVNDVIRIWADTKLIYDKTGENTDVSIPGLLFKLYNGTEDQLPDPTIERDQGVGSTPAFRGLAYVVFQSMPLAEFGNSVPSMEFEVVAGESTQRIQTVGTALYNDVHDYDDHWFGVDWDRGYCYYVEFDEAIARVNMNNGNQDRSRALSEIFDPPATISTYGGMGIASNGDLLVTLTGGNASPVVLVDPDGLYEKKRFGGFSTETAMTPFFWRQVTKMAFPSCYDDSETYHFAVCGSVQAGNIGVLSVPDMEFLYSTSEQPLNITDSHGDIIGICKGKSAKGFCEAWAAAVTGGIISIYKITINQNAKWIESQDADPDTYSGISITLHQQITAADIVPAGSLAKIIGPIYNEYDDTLLFFGANTSIGDQRVIKYDPVSETKLWQTENIAASGNGFTTEDHWSYSRSTDYTFGWIADKNGVQINTLDGSLIHNHDAPDWEFGGVQGTGSYDSKTQSFVGFLPGKPFVRYFFGRNDGVGSTLQNIVTDLSTRADIDLADIDATDLSSITVPGYLVGEPMSSREAIEPLAQLYQFDGFESDHKLKYVFRGQDPVISLTEEDMGIYDTKTGDVVTEERIQEVELPNRLTVIYYNGELDYRLQSHASKRTLAPNLTMSSNQEVSFEIEASLDPDVAKQQSEKMLYSEWIERSNYGFNWPWKYIALDPSDVVDVTLNDGTAIRQRITDLDVGLNLSMQVLGVSEVANQYTSTATAYSGTGTKSQKIITSYNITAFIVDVPFLTDNVTIDPNHSKLHSFVSGYRDGTFSSAIVIPDASNTVVLSSAPDIVTKQIVGASYGTTVNAMPDPPINAVHQTDAFSALTVVMDVGGEQMQTISDIEMMNGGNRALLLKTNGEVELIHFRFAESVGDKTYDLKYFLRGRRGTDTMAFNHTIGERFILLKNSGVDAAVLKSLDIGINQEIAYRAIGYKQVLKDGKKVSITSQHRTHMPYAPGGITATLDGSDIDFAWSRRDRFGSDLVDGASDILLSEDTLEFEIEILESSGGAVKRTVASLPTPEYTYQNADIITDFGAIPTTISVKVYQISAQVGRGFTQEYAIDVL